MEGPENRNEDRGDDREDEVEGHADFQEIVESVAACPVNIGVGEVFILPGKGWVYHTIEICRMIKEDLKRLMLFHHRIQKVVKMVLLDFLET